MVPLWWLKINSEVLTWTLSLLLCSFEKGLLYHNESYYTRRKLQKSIVYFHIR